MKHYKVVKSTVREQWKIKITLTWFGMSIWSVYHSGILQQSLLDYTYDTGQEAEDAAKALRDDESERYI